MAERPPAVDGDVTPPPAPYDAMAEDYAAANDKNPFNALYERPAIIDLIGDVRAKQVLDVGCGSGPLSERLAEQGADVTGFDVSSEMIAIARRRDLENATFYVADLAQPLEFLPDAGFDLAVASLVMHYLQDWVKLTQRPAFLFFKLAANT